MKGMFHLFRIVNHISCGLFHNEDKLMMKQVSAVREFGLAHELIDTLGYVI